MFDIIPFSMGIKTWAATSKVLRRLNRDRTKPRSVGNREEDHGVTGRTNDSPARSRTTVAARRKSERLPLAIQILDDPGSVDQQQGCPLFAKLPAELRELVWDYALTAYEDLDALYPLEKPYARPGQAGPLRIAVDLLFTCRAVYLEAFLVPFRVNPMTVFDGHPDVVPPDNPLQCTTSNLRLCSKLRPWQFANITSVDMNVQQFMLEGGAIERVSRLSGNKGRHEGHEARGFTLAGYASFGPSKETRRTTTTTTTTTGDVPLRAGAAETRAALTRSIFAGKKVTRLTLRMSRTDWWSWTASPRAGAADAHEALRLEPMMNVTDRRGASGAMRAGHEARAAGREPDFGLDEFERQGRWGAQLAEHWPDLRALTLVLETHAAKAAQLDDVVRCARLWTFPLPRGARLAWDGTDLPPVRWRGADEYAYDEELGMSSWVSSSGADRSASRSGDGGALLRWRPDGAGGADTTDGQEFVMRTLVFTWQKCVDATVSASSSLDV